MIPIGLNYSVMDVDVGYGVTLTATVPSGSGGTLTWSTSNSYVATVNASGYVFGQHAGTAVITATYTSASGATASASCTVYVTVADGLYYMKNASSDLCFYTGGSAVSLQSYQTDEDLRITRLWRITYVADGRYDICPIRDTSTALTVDSANYLAVGEKETAGCWGIAENSFGYAIQYLGNGDENAKPVVADMPGSRIYLGDWQSSLSCHWDLEPAAGLFLRDMNTQTLASASTEYFWGLGGSASLADLGIICECYGYMNGDLALTPNDSSVISVDTSGKLTGKSHGVTQITVSAELNGMNYSYSCYVQVKSSVLVLSNKAEDWMSTSQTMGTNLAASVGADNSYVQAVTSENFADAWNNSTEDHVIIHTHGSPECIEGEDLWFFAHDITQQLERNTAIGFVLIIACETGGQNGTEQNFASLLSEYIAEDGIVVCATTPVEGVDEIFIAQEGGQWIAYCNGEQIECDLPTTITMALVAEYWEEFK